MSKRSPALPSLDGDLIVPVDDVLDGLSSADSLSELSISPSTRKLYRRTFEQFQRWADENGIESLPATPDGVRAFLGHLHKLGRSPSRLAVVASAISLFHRDALFPDPTDVDQTKSALRGARRKDANRTKRKAQAIMTGVDDAVGDLQRIIDVIPHDLVGLRDRALLLFGWAGAFRRSEHTGLTLGQVEWRKRGLLVHLGRTKGNQEGKRQTKVILRGKTLCPVTALRTWLDALEAATGREKSCPSEDERAALPLFVGFGRAKKIVGHDGKIIASPTIRQNQLTPQVVNLVLKRWALAAGMDATRLSGHSLRRGFIKTAARRHKTLAQIKAMTLQKTTAILLNEYIEPEATFLDNAGADLL